MHATAFLSGNKEIDVPALVVMHGGEAHLKEASRDRLCRLVLGEREDASIGLTRFAGKDAEWKSVRDELLTVSMFGDRRLVIVEDSDDFVSRFRDALESYAQQPARQGTLVLDVKSWRKNTRLAKKIAESGLELDCSELQGAQLAAWLGEEAKRQGKQLGREAAALMVELAGSGLTLLDQELAKLIAYIGDRERITPDDVRTLVGGWRAETTWKMTDSVRDGRSASALQALEKLMAAGEAPQKILGGINYVFRKYSRATELSRQGVPLRTALQQAGVFPRDVEAAEGYLRRIGRPRAERILTWLVEADGGLKGGSRVAERLQLEQLLLKLGGRI
jgi:DNA polymerase-3 subunit delta